MCKVAVWAYSMLEMNGQIYTAAVLNATTFKYIQTYPKREENVISEDIMLIGSHVRHLV